MKKCSFFVTDRQTPIVFMVFGWFADTFREQHGSQLTFFEKVITFPEQHESQLTFLIKFQEVALI